MVILKHAGQLKSYISQQKTGSRNIGFVPTMGALHKGHLALAEAAKKDTGTVVCSIFVNPTQFNNAVDYQKYPSTLESDIYQMELAGVDILYLPDIAEMYPRGTDNLEHYDLGYLETTLEGKYRPGHFQGVCQVMSRLLTLVRPGALFMGQKDYQQCMVIKRLLQLIPLETRFITCPTVREPDGLAMSSRNLRLSGEDRINALAIYKSLEYIKQAAGTKDPDLSAIKTHAFQMLEQHGFRVDYVEIAEAETLKPVTDYDVSVPGVALIAAFLGEVRLIDNMVLS